MQPHSAKMFGISGCSRVGQHSFPQETTGAEWNLRSNHRVLCGAITAGTGACMHRRNTSMRKAFLASVATAALLAATGIAAAQGTNPGGKGGESPAAASPRGDSGGAASSPSMSRESPSAQTKDMAPKSGSTAEEKGGSKSMPQQAQDKAGTATDKSTTHTSGDMNKDSKSKSSSDNTAAGAAKSSSENAPAGSAKGANPTADSKAGSNNTESKTTGNAATSATAAPPAEKQSQIASAIKSEKVEEVTNVNFNISVGATVPGSVRYHPLPSRIVEIYPEWRGYDFILVRGRYIILRPQTHEIIYIIEG